MQGFREFAMQEFKIRGIEYRPNCIPSGVSKTGIRKGGPAYMNLAAAIGPSRPVIPLFRMGKSQRKSQIVLKKH